MAVGRPSEYKEKVNETVKKLIPYWVITGITEEEIANKINVSYSTLREWKKKYPEFSALLKESRATADDMVEGVLFKKAMSGDTVAMIFWLKNRRPDKWKDKREYEPAVKTEPLKVVKVSEANGT